MARKIVELLLNDSGVCGLLAGTMESRLDAAARRSPTGEVQVSMPISRRSRKLSPPVVDFLHNRRDLPIPVLVEEVQRRFGVSISPGSVYKAWKMKMSERNERTA